jgi:chromosome segregation protein
MVMTDILINMIGDLKTCLALALGSGFIFGYIYNKFKAKERYKPEIKNLKHKIQSKREEMKVLSAKNSDISVEVEKYTDQLNNTNLEITKLKNQIADLEINKNELLKEETAIKDQYIKQKSILNDYQEEIKKLKDRLRIEDIANLEDRKSTLQAEAANIADTYKQKCDSYEGLFNEKRELEKEISNLTSNIASLKATLHQKEQHILNSSNNISALREKLQNEFNKLIESKEENEDRITYFKKELLALKDKLSLS